jgi:threonyl-tRNA synthetase
MTLTDAHIFVRPDQIKEEVISAYELIETVIADLGLEIAYIEFATRDDSKSKFHDNDALWNLAETILEDVLKEADIPYKKVPGEAAFYGPKIDFQVKTVLGHMITMSTIQLDFLLPERFDLNYINASGEKERPVVIHRGYISTFERLMSILLEQYKGAFPIWLAPVQAIIIPVNEAIHGAHAETLKKRLIDLGYRVKVDTRDEKLGYKIRDAQTQKIPYQLVIGDQEMANDQVTYRQYGSSDQHTVNAAEFEDLLAADVARKSRPQ